MCICGSAVVDCILLCYTTLHNHTTYYMSYRDSGFPPPIHNNTTDVTDAFLVFSQALLERNSFLAEYTDDLFHLKRKEMRYTEEFIGDQDVCIACGIASEGVDPKGEHVLVLKSVSTTLTQW